MWISIVLICVIATTLVITVALCKASGRASRWEEYMLYKMECEAAENESEEPV